MNMYNLIHNALCIMVFVDLYSYSCSYYHEQSVKTITPSQKLVKNAYFGYSVTYVPSNKRLIAGAPNISVKGAIFECDIFKNTCIENSPTLDLKEKELSEYDGYWFGAAVEAGNDFYVACAPRASTGYVGMFDRTIMKQLEGTAGLCFIRNFDDEDNSWDELNLMHNELSKMYSCDIASRNPIETCQDSFGWTISVYNESILVGGPAISSGRIGFYQNSASKPKIRMGSITSSYYNYGYTVLLRPVNGTLLYFITYTRASEGNVEVIDFDETFEVKKKVVYKDNQLSNMYGAALSLIKHKNQDYLLVGAPSHSDDELNRFDLGLVYVYNLAIKHKRSILGKHAGGYFGYKIINVGDLNSDGTDDVAISAPYEDNGIGAVYIYSGADMAESPKTAEPIQRIQRKDAIFLGLSMTAMSDLDDNGCSGLGIGAPGNNEVFVLHCIPTVTVTLKVDPLPNLQVRRNSTSDKVNETYFSLPWCLNIIYPEKLSLIKLDLLINVDLVHEYAALVNNGEDKLENNSIIHKIALREKKTQLCKETTIHLPDGGNYEKAMEFSIVTKQVNDPRLDRDLKPSHAMLSDLSILAFGPQQIWATECSNQEACSPNLHAEVNTTLSKDYVIGSTEEESIFISITNFGDTAYQSCVRFIVNGVKVKQPTDCKESSQNEWLCRSPGPLGNIKPWIINTIILEMGSLNNKAKEVSYEVQVQNDCYTTSEKIPATYHLRSDEEGVIITGTDNFESLVYIRDNQEQHVNHKYEITNNGSTNWIDLNFTLKLTKQKYLSGYSSRNLQISTEGFILPTNCVPNYGVDFTEVVCIIDSLNKGQIVTVSMSNTIFSIKNLENDMNITVDTALYLNLGATIKTKSVKTTLQIQKPVIPIWIIIVSIFFGFVLFLIMACIFYELGCFKRKDKKKFEELRSSVRRQTMRKSTSEVFESTKKGEKDLMVCDDDFLIGDGSCEIIEPDDTRFDVTAGTSSLTP